jgi:hypothetical protein
MRHYGRTLLPAVLGSLALVTLAYAGSSDKVTICHFPPGNPDNYQTITISASALPAHLAHGDYPGPCANDCKLFGTSCNDNNLCTTDTCNPDGTCANTQAVDCTNTNPCIQSSQCDPATGACVDTPSPAGTACTGSDVCSTYSCDGSGNCVGTSIPNCCETDAQCDDSNPCTTDTCTANACTHTAVACSAPDDPCEIAACSSTDGTCSTAPITCPRGSVCTRLSCGTPAGPGAYACSPAGTCPAGGSAVACIQAGSVGNNCLTCLLTYESCTAATSYCSLAWPGDQPGDQCSNPSYNDLCTAEVTAAGCASACCPS